MTESLFDMENLNCLECGRLLDGGSCGWCLSASAPTLVRHDAMDTSLAAAKRAGKGTKQGIYVLLSDNPAGLTDMEIEDITGLPHQSASAARRGLVVAGLVEDSGERRKNSRGNDAAVWRLVSPYRKEPNDPAPAVDNADPVSDASCPSCGTYTDEHYANCVEFDDVSYPFKFIEGGQ